MGHKDKEKKRHRDEDPQEREKRKAAKKAERVAEALGYTNETNPFGDSNLLQPFVWGKKLTKDKNEGKKANEGDTEMNRLKLMEDIDRVRKRREEREKELEEMERLRGEEQRLRESAMYGDWQQKEEEFHLEQTVVRSKLRLCDNRQEPIDVLAKNILMIESALAAEADKDTISKDIGLFNQDVELRDPIALIESLDTAQLDQLLEDADNYYQLEVTKKGRYESFWAALKIVVAAERKRTAASSSSSSSSRGGGSGSVHKSIASDVEDLFVGKTEDELDALQSDIDRSIREQRGGDVSYWEEMSEQLKLQRARSYVQKTHRLLLQKQIEILSRIRSSRASSSEHHDDEKSSSSSSSSNSDFKFVRSGGDVGGAEGEDAAFAKLAKEKGLEDKEEEMGTKEEVMLPGSTYWWQDKYRPRKPRYFNRVRTGWDWNKYNQTHYDFDNPPPKKIQGYKFTIFYPDLIDKTKTPQYFVEATDEKEFAIIRFHAGPPYEDVAFKILNKEWEINRKAGFKCVFDRGILQVHFNFKRSFYRR